MQDSAQVKDFFEENGFYGPFKVYEEDEAREMLRTIRKESSQ